MLLYFIPFYDSITFHWRREWQPTPVFLPGEFHGQRSLVVYSPRGHKRVRHDWATNTQYSIAWLYHVLFIHSSLDGYLDIVSTFLAIMNNAAMNICEQDFMSSYVFNSLGYVPVLDLLVIHGNCMFDWGLVRMCFHSGWTTVCQYLQGPLVSMLILTRALMWTKWLGPQCFWHFTFWNFDSLFWSMIMSQCCIGKI